MNEISIYSDNHFKSIVGYILTKLDTTCTLLDLNNCLYLLEEKSILGTGKPILWQQFKVWDKGPICYNLYCEFLENIRFKQKNTSLGLYGFLSVPGGKWSSRVSLIDNYDLDELSDYEVELIDSLCEDFYTNIINNTWLFRFIGTTYHEYTQTENVIKDWELMNGKSNTTINWLHKLDDVKAFNFSVCFEAQESYYSL